MGQLLHVRAFYVPAVLQLCFVLGVLVKVFCDLGGKRCCIAVHLVLLIITAIFHPEGKMKAEVVRSLASRRPLFYHFDPPTEAETPTMSDTMKCPLGLPGKQRSSLVGIREEVSRILLLHAGC